MIDFGVVEEWHRRWGHRIAQLFGLELVYRMRLRPLGLEADCFTADKDGNAVITADRCLNSAAEDPERHTESIGGWRALVAYVIARIGCVLR